LRHRFSRELRVGSYLAWYHELAKNRPVKGRSATLVRPMTDRPIRYSVRGWKRRRRLLFRLADQLRNLLVQSAAIETELPTCW
jgi:hypothetical protein